MRLRNSLLLLSIPILLSACFDSTQKKKYSVTTFFTSFDSAHVSLKNLNKKFKYSYEEFNADSNLIYKEQFTTTFNDDNKWGKLSEIEKYIYDGKKKIKADREYGIYLSNSQLGRGKGKGTYTYEYTNGELTKWLVDQKLSESYKYNRQKELVELHMYFGSDTSNSSYSVNTYFNGLKIRSEYFPFDSIHTSVDTFIYKNNKLIEKNSFNKKGDTTAHRVFILDGRGEVIEEKWKEPFLDWRQRENGQWINAEFNQGNRYFYDPRGRPIKTEYYRSDEHYGLEKLVTVYDFQYD
jgi:hypothetical protein